jgi:TonB-dependent SusC/RagA subfamily outer membrane receptor
MQKPFILLLAPFLASAQPAAEQRLFNQPTVIKDCRIRIDADLFAATTTVELELFNPQSKEVEVLLPFSLQEGQLITGFYLELNGQYREGSIEERWKANRAYSTVVGKRIDPALLQKAWNNQYRLNVYPVPAQGSRKVKLIIQQAMEDADGKIGYTLPLQFQRKTGHTQIELRAKRIAYPLIRDSGMLLHPSVQLTASGLQLEQDSLEILQPIAFHWKVPYETVFQAPASHEQPFSYIKCFIKKENRYATKASKLTIYWDVSASAANRLRNQELKLLESFIQRHRINEVECILFHNQVIGKLYLHPPKESFKPFAETLRNWPVSGSTRLSCLDLAKAEGDLIFIFTDGCNTYGSPLPTKSKVPVFAIGSGTKKSAATLSKLVDSTGGQIVWLNAKEKIPVQAMDSVYSMLLYYGTASNQNTTLLSQQNDLLFFKVKQPQLADTLALRFGNKLANRQQFRLPVNGLPGNESSSVAILDLLEEYQQLSLKGSWIDQLKFGISRQVVTNYTSFIVLERVIDYKQFHIEPPASLKDSCENMNYYYSKALKLESIHRRWLQEKRKGAVDQVNNRINWWLLQTKQHALTGFLMHQPGETLHSSATVSLINAQAVSSSQAERNNLTKGTQELNCVVVTAFNTQRQAKELGYSTARVTAADLTRTNPVNLANGLTGKVSGLMIQTVNNSVFGDTRITLRGIRSLTGNNQPMLILDGIAMSLNQLSNINPNDIQHVSILKSASATALYGSEGVNGAILIQTKRGWNRASVRWTSYRLDSQEDEDYLIEIREASSVERDALIQQLTSINARNPCFHLDLANYYFSNNEPSNAQASLHNMVEAAGTPQAQTLMAYTLESWKLWAEAIAIYDQQIVDDPANLAYRHDRALALFQKGDALAAAQAYLELLEQNTNNEADQTYFTMSWTELNALYHQYGSQLPAKWIDSNWIRHTPMDLYVSAYGSEHLNGMQVKEPSGQSESNGWKGYKRFPETDNDYYYKRNLEYVCIKADSGLYRFSLPCYQYAANPAEVNFVRLVSIQHFQQPGQQIRVQEVLLNNQYGEVEFASLWQPKAR